jgi:hypothetical protein
MPRKWPKLLWRSEMLGPVTLNMASLIRDRDFIGTASAFRKSWWVMVVSFEMHGPVIAAGDVCPDNLVSCQRVD